MVKLKSKSKPIKKVGGKAKKLGGKVKGKGLYDILEKTVGRVAKAIRGERGLTLYNSNYCGPFNAIDEAYQKSHPPTNRIDAICLQHDLNYNKALEQKKAGNKAAYESITKYADNVMVNSIDAIKDKTTGEKLLGGVARTGIRFKQGIDNTFGAGKIKIPAVRDHYPQKIADSFNLTMDNKHTLKL